jgi:diguanylate cyclase (GGDEF)-like protein
VLEQDLRRLATVDPLTGTLNRRSFFDLAAQEFSHSRRHDRRLAAIMLDIDHFKSVNDTYGHQTGDEVIRAVAEVCRDVLRERDIMGRLGGEEFACVLPDSSVEQSMIVAERLRAAVATRCFKSQSHRHDHITVSVGVANLVESDVDVSAVLDRADAALYEAKRTGRNRVLRNEGQHAVR